MVNNNIICVFDGEAGSCGKAKVCGEIATNPIYSVGASLTNSMPNAGHTFVDEYGVSHLFRNIPVASVNKEVELFIGPSSVIDMDEFKREYDEHEHFLGDRKIYVHELVPLVTEEHKMREKRIIKSGSTYHGCAACNQDKIIRNPELEFFKGYKNAVVLKNVDWLDLLYKHLDSKDETVLFEGAQGCDLSLNFSGEHPNVTSRNISVANMLQEAGVSPRRLLYADMVIRPFPIRINDITRDGAYIYTGGYGSADKLTWSHINFASKFGVYPTLDQFSDYEEISDEIKIKLLNQTTNRDKLQIFGINYANVSVSDVTVVDALEMERLINKRMGIRKYISGVIDLSGLEDPYLTDLSEITSVTRMERKIFDLDIRKLKQNVRMNDPDGIYLNFFQHLNIDFAHKTGEYENVDIDRYVREYLNWLETTLGVDLNYLGTGKINHECIKKKELTL